MSSSVPTPDEFIQSFPHQLTKITGIPTFATLTNLRNQLKANAASVPTTRGGGEHGYLGIVLSDAIYNTISNTPWTVANHPGINPVVPPAATAHTTARIVREHTENMRQWREYQNVESALKKQLTNAIEPIYLRAIRNRHTGYANQTLRQILHYLFTAYGSLQPNELQLNQSKLQEPWDPNTPFELLIDQIEECMEIADAGGQPFTPTQIINTAYTLVFNTGMYFDECKTWRQLPNNDKTWTQFKTHFLEAQKDLRLQQQTTQQAGFHANFASTHNANETATALANLAEATASDREAFAALVTTNSNLTKQLTEALEEIKKLKKRLNNRRAPEPNNNYCWTHGYSVHKNHTSATCRNPAEGHQREATRDNPMGGSSQGK